MQQCWFVFANITEFSERLSVLYHQRVTWDRMLSLLCTPGLLLYKAHVDTQSLMTMSYNTEQSVQFGRHMPVGQLAWHETPRILQRVIMNHLFPLSLPVLACDTRIIPRRTRGDPLQGTRICLWSYIKAPCSHAHYLQCVYRLPFICTMLIYPISWQLHILLFLNIHSAHGYTLIKYSMTN